MGGGKVERAFLSFDGGDGEAWEDFEERFRSYLILHDLHGTLENNSTAQKEDIVKTTAHLRLALSPQVGRLVRGMQAPAAWAMLSRIYSGGTAVHQLQSAIWTRTWRKADTIIPFFTDIIALNQRLRLYNAEYSDATLKATVLPKLPLTLRLLGAPTAHMEDVTFIDWMCALNNTVTVGNFEISLDDDRPHENDDSQKRTQHYTQTGATNCESAKPIASRPSRRRPRTAP